MYPICTNFFATINPYCVHFAFHFAIKNNCTFGRHSWLHRFSFVLVVLKVQTYLQHQHDFVELECWKKFDKVESQQWSIVSMRVFQFAHLCFISGELLLTLWIQYTIVIPAFCVLVKYFHNINLCCCFILLHFCPELSLIVIMCFTMFCAISPIHQT